MALIQPRDRGEAFEPRPDLLRKRRHLEVLAYLARGESNKEIARRLDLTEGTIKVYVRELMRHFSAKNRMQVVLKASALDQPQASAHVTGNKASSVVSGDLLKASGW